MDLTIRYKDSSLVLCIKPVGVESEGEGMPRLLERQLGGSVFCVHRLDQAVGGLMVYARTRQAAAALSAAVARRETCGAYTDGELAALARACKVFILPMTGVCGFDQAQVTAGGLRTDEFCPETMESRLVPGLYGCGEVLDVDGDCGGFNLQWAWASGRLAGENAANC